MQGPGINNERISIVINNKKSVLNGRSAAAAPLSEHSEPHCALGGQQLVSCLESTANILLEEEESEP